MQTSSMGSRVLSILKEWVIRFGFDARVTSLAAVASFWASVVTSVAERVSGGVVTVTSASSELAMISSDCPNSVITCLQASKWGREGGSGADPLQVITTPTLVATPEGLLMYTE
jgi:hypothetical protein